MKRVLRKVSQLIRQSSPDGLMSLSYIYARKGSLTAMHRTFWWHGKHRALPRPVWLVLQFWYWFRWVFFDAWRHIYFGLKYYGRNLSLSCDIPLSSQFVYLVRTTFWWAIPTYELYEYGLVCGQKPALGFVFVTEATGLHKYLNKRHTQSDAAILGDKLTTQRHLEKLGVPVPDTKVIHKSADPCPIEDVLSSHQSPIFCKQNNSNQAIGAFQAHMDKGIISGRLYDGTNLDNMGVQDAWLKLCKMNDALVQPMLQSDVSIQTNPKTDTLVTLRVVTRKIADCYDIFSARLEIPVWSNNSQKRISHILLPVDINTGQIESLSEYNHLDTETQRWISSQISSLPAITPHWNEIVLHSKTAHTSFDLWGIAWDWAITSEGPILLEGNSGWGLEATQMKNKGLLTQLGYSE